MVSSEHAFTPDAEVRLVCHKGRWDVLVRRRGVKHWHSDYPPWELRDERTARAWFEEVVAFYGGDRQQ